MIKQLRSFFWKIAQKIFPDLQYVDAYKEYAHGKLLESTIADKVKLNPPYLIHKSSIDRYSYVSANATISYATIGQFCSIGPNFLCGWGIHPVDGVSTSPMFYSTQKQNGYIFCNESKIEERKTITIGNDVFIGMNVTVLDGVSIGDGVVIGAGTVVSKNVAPYNIVAGNPMQFIRKRFDDDTIDKLMKMKWWDWPEEQLGNIEKDFFNVSQFINNNKPSL